MATRKNLGRWPMTFGDYNEAIAGNIDPVPKELFLDTVGKDLYYYDPSGVYVSIISLIRAGIVNTWLPPCISYEAILAKWPDPPLCSVCAAIDSGIIYEYIGNGNWIPISSNAIPIVSSETNGLMSTDMYESLMEYEKGVKYKYIEQGQPIPIPRNRKPNCYYHVWTNTRTTAEEILWVELNKVDSIEDAIKPDWPYDQLFLIGKSDNVKDEIYEIVDPLVHIVRSESQVVEEEIPEEYSGLYYMVPAGVIIETVNPTSYTYGAYPDDWLYDKNFYRDSDGNMNTITDPGYLSVKTDDKVVPVKPAEGITDVYYRVLKNTVDN